MTENGDTWEAEARFRTGERSRVTPHEPVTLEIIILVLFFGMDTAELHASAAWDQN